jgi:hypothetical protein
MTTFKRGTFSTAQSTVGSARCWNTATVPIRREDVPAVVPSQKRQRVLCDAGLRNGVHYLADGPVEACKAIADGSAGRGTVECVHRELRPMDMVAGDWAGGTSGNQGEHRNPQVCQYATWVR